MQAGKEEELGELLDVALANAGADPRAMVVVHFHAHLTSVAVEGAGRSKHFARVAPGQFVHFGVQGLLQGQWDVVVLELVC